MSNRLRKHALRHMQGLDPVYLNQLGIDGHLDMTDAYRIIFGDAGYFYRLGANLIGVSGSLRIGGDFQWNTMECTVGDAKFSAKSVVGGKVDFCAYKTGFPPAEHVCAVLQDDAAEPYWGLPRCGDITLLDGKVIQWSDVNLYRHDANVLRTDDTLLVGDSDYNVAISNTLARIYFGDRASAWDINLYRGGANHLKTDDVFDAALGFRVGAAVGADGNFTTVDGKTVTVTKGLITSIV